MFFCHRFGLGLAYWPIRFECSSSCVRNDFSYSWVKILRILREGVTSSNPVELGHSGVSFLFVHSVEGTDQDFGCRVSMPSFLCSD